MQFRFPLVLVLLIAGSPPAMACSCGPPDPSWTLADRVSQYTSVFYGEVISVQTVDGGYFDRALRLKVIRRYRGELASEATVFTQSLARSMCGIRREIGDRFIVASSLFEGVESISYCSAEGQTGFTRDALEVLPFVDGPPTPRPSRPMPPLSKLPAARAR